MRVGWLVAVLLILPGLVEAEPDRYPPEARDARQAEPPRWERDRACGTKRFCKEMTSCEEARFYLKTCGLRRLDGDHDGVPCESLCR